LDQAGEIDAYTFTATAQMRIYYDALETDSDVFEVNLLSPSGRRSSVAGDTDNNGRPTTLTEDGVYQLLIGGRQDAPGDYAFRLLNLAVQPEVSLGADVTGTFDPRLHSIVYRLTGSANQALRFTPLSGGAAVGWRLYAPDGRSIGGVSLGREFEVTLPADGTYLLVLDASDGAMPLNFGFRVTELTKIAP
jgi:hypothetical protein